MDKKNKSGFVAIIGKPNVGKSTLINSIIGKKISIISPRPGTTRIKILGVKNLDPNTQIVFLDTPGIYKNKDALEVAMIEQSKQSIKDADIILFLIDATEGWTKEDIRIFDNFVKPSNKPIILVINKIDQIKSEENLQQIIKESKEKHNFADMIPISALNRVGLDKLLEKIKELLPEGDFFFPDENYTNLPERILIAEIIREKVLYYVYQELPQEVAVVVNEIRPGKSREDIMYIQADIVVSKDKYKPMILGEKGNKIKKIGTLARKEIESILGKKVFLELNVKVKEDWRDRMEFVRGFGYFM